ncbi:MAG TPA: hypothetical protein VEK37_01120 [Gemmatimonadaceae bacterium]|nr:hypothetical protein [Gemmatimonadaceae bacterium]
MKAAWLVVCLAVVFASAVGCNPFAPNQSVILPVTKVEAPATAGTGSAFSVTLTVQTGGCTRFDRIDVQKVAAGARMIPWGTNASIGHKNVSCPDDIRYEPHTVQLDPPFADPFTITVEQGDSAPITTVVRIQ